MGASGMAAPGGRVQEVAKSIFYRGWEIFWAQQISNYSDKFNKLLWPCDLSPQVPKDLATPLTTTTLWLAGTFRLRSIQRLLVLPILYPTGLQLNIRRCVRPSARTRLPRIAMWRSLTVSYQHTVTKTATLEQLTTLHEVTSLRRWR
jgi:hypothetical protein